MLLYTSIQRTGVLRTRSKNCTTVVLEYSKYILLQQHTGTLSSLENSVYCTVRMNRYSLQFLTLPVKATTGVRVVPGMTYAIFSIHSIILVPVMPNNKYITNEGIQDVSRVRVWLWRLMQPTMDLISR